MEASDEAPGPPRLRVKGRASAEEIAAVVAALAGRDGSPEPRRETPPWLRAGLREGVGGPTAAAPADLD